MTAADDCNWDVVVIVGQGSEACEIAIGPPPLDRMLSWIAAVAEDAPPPESRVLRRGLKAMLAPSPGREPIDDRAALAEALDLLRSGRFKTARQACLAVAKARESSPAIDATAERLRRKLRKMG